LFLLLILWLPEWHPAKPDTLTLCVADRSHPAVRQLCEPFMSRGQIRSPHGLKLRRDLTARQLAVHNRFRLRVLTFDDLLLKGGNTQMLPRWRIGHGKWRTLPEGELQAVPRYLEYFEHVGDEWYRPKIEKDYELRRLKAEFIHMHGEFEPDSDVWAEWERWGRDAGGYYYIWDESVVDYPDEPIYRGMPCGLPSPFLGEK
tara:strand:- start:3957 stop:4559 length:603 start_codon:yes stop_codon:yes gene_type:complete